MGRTTPAQSRGGASAPENNDEPFKRDQSSRKESGGTDGVPDKKQALSFTDDLPAEIRLQIYRHLFNIPNKSFQLMCPGCSGLWSFSCMDLYPVSAGHEGGLCMMRVCKKIRGEVAEYFYGTNNFQISQPSCMDATSYFFKTIGSFNCSFLKHITVHLPILWLNTPNLDGQRDCRWKELCGVGHCQEMRDAYDEYQPSYKGDPQPWRGWYDDNDPVHGAFSQLRKMPNLKKLELTIPTQCDLFDFQPWQPDSQCGYVGVNFQTMSPDDRTRHVFQTHAAYEGYFDLLADIKENAASKDLTIALVILYPGKGLFSETLPKIHQLEDRAFGQMESPWIAAYAAIMDYKVGQASWERNNEGYLTYSVRYDKDPCFERRPPLLGNVE